MPASFKLKITNPGLADWPAPIARGLESAGAAYVAEMKKYPPKQVTTSLPEDSGTYRTIDVFNHYERTKTLGHKAQYKVNGETSMNVGGLPATAYVLFGTGIYGPKHEMIRPKSKKVLAWVTSGARPTSAEGWKAARAEGRAFIAKKSRGFIWAGKLDKVKAEIVRGFEVGFKKALRKR